MIVASSNLKQSYTFTTALEHDDVSLHSFYASEHDKASFKQSNFLRDMSNKQSLLEHRRTKKAAISNVITTLILIGIGVIAAAGVYIVYTGYAGSASSNLVAYMTNAQANYANSAGGAVVSVTIKNSGSVAITAATVSIDGSALATQPTWSPSFSSNSPLAAGASASATFSESGWSIGQSHVITILVTGSNGATYTITETITVQ